MFAFLSLWDGGTSVSPVQPEGAQTPLEACRCLPDRVHCPSTTQALGFLITGGGWQSRATAVTPLLLQLRIQRNKQAACGALNLRQRRRRERESFSPGDLNKALSLGGASLPIGKLQRTWGEAQRELATCQASAATLSTAGQGEAISSPSSP